MLMKSPLPYDAHPYLQEGMPVQVIRGPLEGIRGTLLRKDKPFRLVISVHLIRQAASVEIDADDVAPV
jgi:transcription antitermination factor NusG